MGNFTKLFLMFAFALGINMGMSQNSVTTSPPLNGGNGQTGVTFNVTANSNLVVTSISSSFYGSGTVEVWYNTTAISGPPNVSATNGWISLGTASITAASTAISGNPPIPIPLTFSVPMLAGQTYGFAIGGPSIVYTTYSSGQSAFSDANMTVETGSNVGYGGPLPAPTFHPRQFNGIVHYNLASTAPNDAGVLSIDSPFVFCSGPQPVVATIRNNGNQILDSCVVNWSVNGINQAPLNYTTPIDTFGGTGANTAQVNLGTFSFASSASILKVWTSLPNGVADTVNTNDTLYATVQPSLNGNYVIGGSNPDFPTFTDAANALAQFGICDDVTFLVADGTYNEQFVLAEIIGTNDSTTVTFMSASNHPDSVTISFANTSAANYVIQFDDADYVTFENITIQTLGTTTSRVIEFKNHATNNTFDNCVILGRLTGNTSTSNLTATIYGNGGGMDDNAFLNSTISGGGYAVYYYGASAELSKNFRVENCVVDQWYYYGFYAYYLDAPKYINNDITCGNNSNTSGYGFYIWYTDNEMEIRGNTLTPSSTGAPLYGIYGYYCDATAAHPSIIANNVITHGLTSSTSSFYTCYINYSGYQNILHNNFVNLGNGTSGRVLYMISGGANTVKNNNFVNMGAGNAAYISTNYTLAEADYNNYYTNGSTFGYYGANVTTFADWQTTSGHDAHSVSVNPNFVSPDYYNTCDSALNNAGTPTTMVMYDQEGDMRSTSTPDIGANEFNLFTDFSLGGDMALCANSTLSLEVETLTGDTIVWMGTDTASTYTVSAVGQYTVYAANSCGSANDTIDVFTPAGVSLPNDTLICAGDVISVSANLMGASFVWSNGASTQSVDLSSAGTYTVTATGMYDCETSDDIVVNVAPAVDLPNDTTFCDGSSIFVDAGISNASYNWSNGLPNAQIVSVNATGVYSVTVTDINGCISTDAIDVTAIPQPDASFTPTVSFLTFYGTVDNPYAGSTYTWDFGDGNSATGNPITYLYSAEGQYTVILTVTNECGTANSTDEAAINVGINELNNAAHIVAFPNPSNGAFTLNFNKTSNNGTIQLIDLSGRILMTENIGAGQTQLSVDAANISAGYYTLKLVEGDAVSQLPIIIK